MSNQERTAPVLPTLPVYDTESAKAAGFEPITTDISITLEPAIFLSVQAGLKNTLACWIIVRPGVFRAGRAKSELWTGT